MRRLSVLFLFSLVAYPQSIPVLSQSQIQQLEITVAQNPASQSQALLGQNYALVILGITALGQYNVVTNVDPGLAQSTFAQHARYALQTSISPGVPGEGGEALWNLSFQLQGYLAQHPTAGMTYLDARELGVQVLDRAVTLEPANPTWRYYRIPILDNRSNFNLLPLTAGDAFMQAKEDISYLTGAIRNALLPTLAKLAVRAAVLDDAENYAVELLASAAEPQNWNYGNAIFFGNMVLGQVAFRRGDVGSAVSRLLSSGKTPGSPQLNSFGPNMALAKDLLTSSFRPSAQNRNGRPMPRPPHGGPTPDIQQSVLNFFDLCRVFWTMGANQLDNWSMQVKAGVVPDFGANLYY